MSYFTSRETFFVVPLDTNDGEIQKIDILLKILEESGVGDLIEKQNYKSSEIGRKSYNPYQMLVAVLYCFAKHKGSLRDSEEMCRYDMRLQYILGQQTPSYKTISEFINKVILPNTYEIFSLITSAIIKHFNIDISDQYLDGTKLEANANKYKFVWKPNRRKKILEERIAKYIELIGSGISGDITPEKLFVIVEEYREKNAIILEEIPQGKGHRKTETQRTYLEGIALLTKLLDYQEKEEICGPDRNSYYKTDHDATAMALKTDYYSGHGSNMHAAYNVQFMSAAGIITIFGVYQHRTDYYTLIPLLEKYKECYHSVPVNLCADSGYGVHINYKYIQENRIGNYVKYLNWNGERNGKNPQLFKLNKDQTGFICLNGNEGKMIEFSSKTHQKAKYGKLYFFENCHKCGYSYKCKEKLKIKDADTRQVELNIEYEKLKEEARINLKSIKGIEIRVNRSIQVEGSFGNLKQNLSYVRIRRRGIQKVTCEIMLMCLAINIRRLFTIYKDDTIKTKFWVADNNTRPEEFKKVKEKTVTK